MLCLTIWVKEGGQEAEGREDRDHFIIRHQAFLKQNMQHFPFMRTNSALCVGTVHHSPVWMEVSMQLIVTLLLLEAYGRTMIEILLTERRVVSVCGMLSFSRTDYSAGDSASSLQWQWNGLSLFLDERQCAVVCVFFCMNDRASLCVFVHVLMNSCVYHRRAVCGFVNEGWSACPLFVVSLCA